MMNDELQIRAVIEAWASASAAGDLEGVLRLMTVDVVFLTPGNAPMGRDEFAASFRSMTGSVQLLSRSDVQEITVTGDLAVCWNRLDVNVTPMTTGTAKRFGGDTLTVFRRGADGQWRVWRDANLLAPR